MRAELGKINAVVSEHCANLAPYQFIVVFSQLISRVCHSCDEVFSVLMAIVAKVLLAYPQQAMWLMTAVSKVWARGMSHSQNLAHTHMHSLSLTNSHVQSLTFKFTFFVHHNQFYVLYIICVFLVSSLYQECIKSRQKMKCLLYVCVCCSRLTPPV